MDAATYKARVDAFLEDMRRRNVDPEVVAEILAQLERTDKSAASMNIAYKAHSSAPGHGTPSREADVLEREMTAAGLDPDGPAAAPVWRAWIDYGLKSARAHLVEQQLAQTATFFSDDGRPLVRPLRDKDGRPLP